MLKTNEVMELSVRPIEVRDIDVVADYWFTSEDAFLTDMGVDLAKMPTSAQFGKMLLDQIAQPITHKSSFAVIWELNGNPVGHSNINEIEFGVKAKLHLHLWKSDDRQKGMGTVFVKKSLPFYFELFKLQELYCEPYAINAAPNKTLAKVGFTFLKNYRTIPGYINFEQEVSQWLLLRKDINS